MLLAGGGIGSIDSSGSGSVGSSSGSTSGSGAGSSSVVSVLPFTPASSVLELVSLPALPSVVGGVVELLKDDSFASGVVVGVEVAGGLSAGGFVSSGELSTTGGSSLFSSGSFELEGVSSGSVV